MRWTWALTHATTEIISKAGLKTGKDAQMCRVADTPKKKQYITPKIF